MKNVFLVLMVISTALLAEWVDFGFSGLDHAAISVIESTPSSMIIEVEVPGIGLTA